MSVDTRVDLGGIALRNPVLTASGTFGYGTEFAPFLDLTRIGGFVAKSLTLAPRFGNPPPRIAEAPSGMLNAISLENVGVEAFIHEKLPAIPDEAVVIASVFETEIDRYVEVCKRLDAVERIAGLELNASCPHVKSGGIEFGQSPAVLAELIRATRQATRKPLMVKLSPNVTHIAEMTEYHRDTPPPERRPRQPLLRSITSELTGENYPFQEEPPPWTEEENLHPSDVAPETRALADLALVLFNSNEFVYIY